MAAYTAMSNPISAEELKKSSLIVAILTLIAIIALGGALIGIYLDREKHRDLQQWESRLGLAVDTRAANLAAVTDRNFTDLSELAGNASLQLYLSQVNQLRASSAGGKPPAQLDYLRNLVIASASRLGYGGRADARVPANLVQTTDSGLALLNAQLRPVVVTPGTPALTAETRQAALAALESGSRRTSSIHLDEQGQALIAYAIAVPAVLGTGAAEQAAAVGVIVGIRPATQEIFPVLAGREFFAEDNEALLLEKKTDQVWYLSPTRDGATALSRSIPVTRPSLAGAAAVTQPGRFAQLNNYRGEPVLQLSRKVRGQPWVVAQQVNAKQALRESQQRRRFLLGSLSLLLLAVAALAIAAWRHGSSVRARHKAAELDEKTQELRKQSGLLNAISGNINALTMLVDTNRDLRFANRAVAKAAEAELEDLTDKHLSAALGSAIAKRLQVEIDQARERGKPTSGSLELELGDEPRHYQASFLPLDSVGDIEEPVLLVLNDITDLQRAQERHTTLLSKLVSTLVQIIDLRDPYTAFHSARMTEVAMALAEELHLPENERTTLEFAATLANLGKILLPAELLTKTGALNEDEREIMESHVSRGLEMLTNLDFSGPVLSTIAQKQEHLDGSGYPRGLDAQEMTLPGRILAVANAFVALVSPRAYREALSVKTALQELMELADEHYDRHVVAALFHVAENRLDWARWRRQGEAHHETQH